MKSASQRSTKHHTSTPYDRPKPKGFVQTVKDWLTPSKWTKEEVNSPLPNRRLPDLTPWPGTPHPIQGRQLDVRGVTHPLSPPTFDEVHEELTGTKKNESPVLVSNKEGESNVRSGSNTPLASTSLPLTYIAQNGLDPPPPPTTTAYSRSPHYPRRGVKTKQKERGPHSSNDAPAAAASLSKTSVVLTSTPDVSPPTYAPPPGPIRTSEVGHATPKSTVSSFPSRGHPSFSLSAFNTPVNTATLTNLSLSRSPFTSPFYTGRTSYGGASSSGRPSSSSLFRKRARNETSPTNVHVGPVKRAVKPHPHTTQFPVGGASHTALKILNTLQSLSTPLQDARKLPLRATPAKKQRIEGSSTTSSATSPPPPVSSLSAPPTHAKLSQVRQPVIHVLASPPTPPPSRGKEKVVIDLTISPRQVKQTQAPPPTPPPSSSKSTSGKIRATKHTTHYSSKSRDEGEAVYNTSELPPPIPLLLHKSGPLPSIDIPFLTPLNKDEPKLTRPPMSSVTTASSYSFTSPEVALRSEPRPHATPISPINSGLFHFSDPLPILVGSTGATRPPLTASGSLSFKAQSVSLPPPSSVSMAPPTLSKPTGSLVDALKKPEYQIENIRKEAKQKSSLSSTTPPVGGDTKGLSAPPLKPLKDVPLIVPTSNWSCDSCWVSNKSDTNKCVACGASQPSGIKKKAVAFSTPSLTSTASGGLKLPPGESLTSTSGGLKIPTGGNLTGGPKLPQGGNVMLAPSGGIFSSSGPPPSSSTSTSIASSGGNGFKLSSGGLLTGNVSGGTNGTTKPSANNESIRISEKTNTQPPTLVTPATNTKSTATPLSSLAPPTSNWECPTCMLHNDPGKDSCPACETPRPGAGSKTSQTGLSSSVKPVQFGDGGGMKLGGGGGLLLTGAASTASSGLSISNKPALQIGSGGGLKLGGGGLNIFGGITSQSQSVSATNTSTSVTQGVATQATASTSSQINVPVPSFLSSNTPPGSSLLSSSSSLPTAPSLLPPAATKPSLFGQSLVTSASPCLSITSSTPPVSLVGSLPMSSSSGTSVGAPLFMQSQQSVSGSSTTFTLPKPDFNKGALSGLKFEAPPPPVLTTTSSEGSSQSLPISVVSSSGFSTLPTTSVGASLFQSFLTTPTSAPVSTTTMFGKPPGGGDGQKLLFGVPSQGSAAVSKAPAPPSLFPSIGTGMGSGGMGMSTGGMGNTGMKTGGMGMSTGGMESTGIKTGGMGMSSAGMNSGVMSTGGMGMSSGGMGMSSGGMSSGGMSTGGMSSGGMSSGGMSSGGMSIGGGMANTGQLMMGGARAGGSGNTSIFQTGNQQQNVLGGGGSMVGTPFHSSQSQAAPNLFGTNITPTPGGLGGQTSTGSSFQNPTLTGTPGGGSGLSSGQSLAPPSQTGFNFSMTPKVNFGMTGNSSTPFQFGSNQQQQQHPLQQGQNVLQQSLQQQKSLQQGLQQQSGQNVFPQGLQGQNVLQQQGGAMSFGMGSPGVGMGGGSGGFSMGSDSGKGKRPIKKAVRRHKLN